MTFIRQPQKPVLLTVNISVTDTMTLMARAVKGLKSSPPMPMTTSLGSYFRNRISGTRPKTVAM